MPAKLYKPAEKYFVPFLFHSFNTKFTSSITHIHNYSCPVLEHESATKAKLINPKNKV